MISWQDRQKQVCIDFQTFMQRNIIDEKDLNVLQDEYGMPKEDVYETLYVIYVQSNKYSSLDEILKTEYKNLGEHQYRNIARHLFNDEAYAEYIREKSA